MTSFSRGRGVHRSNSIPSPKATVQVPAPLSQLCQDFYTSIIEQEPKQLRNIVKAFLNETKETKLEVIKYLLSCLFEDENFTISFMKMYRIITDEHVKENSTMHIKIQLFRKLQEKYEGKEWTTDDSALRICVCVLVTLYTAKITLRSTEQRILPWPILEMFETLLKSKISENIDLLAVLFVKSWNWLKTNTPEVPFENFLVVLREAILTREDKTQVATLLFLLDITEKPPQTAMSQSLLEFYRDKLNPITKYKLAHWLDDNSDDEGLVKKMFKNNESKEAIIKPVSDLSISEKTENASEDVPKQTMPRAIRGTGATDK